MDSDDKFFRARLNELRDQTLQAGAEGEQSAQPVELDQAKVGRLSRMDAMQAQAMSLESKRRRERQLREIGAALARIEAGEYGRCVDCDEIIARARLEFDPAAARCVRCAEIIE